MSNAYSDEDGNFLVELARKTVDEYVTQNKKSKIPEDTPEHLKEKSGVFVTLNSTTGDSVSLRGCIGRPYPSQPLVEAVIDSSVDSAVNDPRFPPVNAKDLDSIIVDLSVLTPPKKIEYSNPEELLNHAKATGLFGGEFIFEKMNFLERLIIKKISGLKESVSKINYETIQQFANRFN